MAFVYALGIFVVVIGMLITSLADLVAMLVLGSKATLSYRISKWVGYDSPGKLWLYTFIASLSFVSGMLVTHFCNFRMLGG